MTAVTGIDDRHLRVHGGGKGSALLGVAHGDDVGVAADGVDGVAHGLTLGGGAGHGLGEAQGAAAQGQHGGFKAQAGAGRGLEEEGGQLLVGTGVLVFGGVCDDVLGGGDQLIDLLHAQVNHIQDITRHGISFLNRSNFRRRDLHGISSGGQCPRGGSCPRRRPRCTRRRSWTGSSWSRWRRQGGPAPSGGRR